MKVVCPKCQFENQADSSRVVCARCATIIEIKPDQGAGLEANGKRQTARLPFVGNVGNSQPLNNPPVNPSRDVYATRIGDDFDDVLDIPRQTQITAPHSNEPTTKFEDVFAMPNYEAPTSPYDLQQQEKKPTGPIEGFPTGSSKQRSTKDYDEAPEPEFMGWPVLPESNDYEQDQAGGFSANRGALLLRVSMVVLVFGLLSVLAYYLLYDKISNRQRGLNDRISSNPAGSAQTYPPATVPSLDAGQSAAKPPVTAPALENQKSPDQTQPNQASGQSSGQKVDIVPVNGKSGHSSSPKPAPTAEPVAAPKQGNLTIQVASFNDQAQANERVNSLRSKGEDARSVKVEIPGKGTWYRVQIGGFKSREDATSHAGQLKSKGILQDYIVTTIGK